MRSLCIDARLLHSGGIGTYLRNLIPLLKSHYKLFLLGSLSDLQVYGKYAELISCTLPIFSWKEQFLLSQFIPPCDLFWSPHYNSPICELRARKRVITIHDLYPLSFKGHFNKAMKWAALGLLKKLKKQASAIITVSTFSEQEIIKWLGKGKIHVIYPGICKTLFTCQSSEVDLDILKLYRIFKPFLFSLGNAKPHKNLQKLKQAVSYPKFPSLYAEENQHIKEEHLPAFYRQAAAFIFPSLYEGFGFPPLEALACGCPVIASPRGALKEVLRDSVVYCDPEDPQDIQKKIGLILENNDLRSSLRIKGKERAQEFCWEKSAEKHMEVYEYCLSS